MRRGSWNSSEIWILAEQKNRQLNEVSFELLNWSRLSVKKRQARLLWSLVISSSIIAEADQTRSNRFCISVLAAGCLQPEPFSACLMELIGHEKPEILIAAATTTGRTLTTYAAGKTAYRAHCGLYETRYRTRKRTVAADTRPPAAYHNHHQDPETGRRWPLFALMH